MTLSTSRAAALAMAAALASAPSLPIMAATPSADDNKLEEVFVIGKRRAYQGNFEDLENPTTIQLIDEDLLRDCLLYTSPSPRDQRVSRMPSSA